MPRPENLTRAGMGQPLKGHADMKISGPPAIIQAIKDHAKATGRKNSEVAIAAFTLYLNTSMDPMIFRLTSTLIRVLTKKPDQSNLSIESPMLLPNGEWICRFYAPGQRHAEYGESAAQALGAAWQAMMGKYLPDDTPSSQRMEIIGAIEQALGVVMP